MKIYNYNKILHLLVVFMFLLLPDIQLKAQTPGGTTALTPEIWLSADKAFSPFPNDGARLPLWTDLSGKGRQFYHTTATVQPTFNASSGLMNYQPSVKFASGNRLMTEPSFRLDPAKSYYVFYVSVSNSGNSQVTVFNFNYNTGNTVGWYNGNPYYSTNSTATGERIEFAQSGTKKNYGIAGVYRPNNTANNEVFYFNGASSNKTGKAMASGSVAAGVTVLGSRGDGSLNPFIGEIQEFIVLSSSTQGAVNDEDVKKINTYLALKYGITLDNQDYISSDGTVAWSRAASTGYTKDIFGIGRDNASGLDQKQSTSYSNSVMTVFVGDEIKKLNRDNATTLINNTFMVFAGNGISGFTPYDPGQFDINTRQRYILKAQTNMSVTVNIETHIRAEYLMVSQTETFDPGTTTFYPVENGLVKDVTIADGNFIGFAFQNASAGGVTGLNTELWLSADKVSGSTPNDGEEISEWLDMTENARDFVQNGTNLLPRYKRNAMNFQPAVEFYRELEDGTETENRTRKLVSKENFPLAANKSYYTFWVSELNKNNASSVNASVFAFGTGTTNDVGWVDNNAVRHATRGTDYDYSPTAGMPTYGIGTAIVPNSAATTPTQQQFHNGKASTATMAGRAMFTGTYVPTPAILGNSNLTDGDYFYGDVQEIIVLSGPSGSQMNATDISKVNSYLAIKYGQTLQNGDYLDSDGNVVWSRSNAATDNGVFTKAIFGIARDDASGLYQKQSTSYDNRTITAYLDQLQELNMLNQGSLATDQAYVMFASNELTGLTPYVYNAGQLFDEGKSITEDINYRQKRILKVQSTSNVAAGQFVNMQVHVDTKYILISPDDTFTPTNTRIYEVDNHVASDVLVKNGDYIGFATYAANPGGTSLDTELWLAADKVEAAVPVDGSSIKYWNDISPNGRNFTQNGTNPVPVISYAGMNYQPAIEFSTDLATNTKLVSKEVFPLSTSNAYYTFWVSEVDNESSAAQATVFAYGENTTTSTNDVGWVGGTGATGGLLRHATRGTDYNFAGKTFPKYGIGAAIVTNNVSVPEEQYFNGFKRTPNIGSRLMYTGTYTPSRAVMGNTGLLAADYFRGKIQEVIVLKAPAGTVIGDTDLKKINSYLAIKHGITLDITAHPDYLRSDGTVVWKGSDNTGYQIGIFGIGYDPASGLFQKQSASTDKRVATVFVGQLADLNTNNTGTIDENKYLMLGSNGLDGFSPYAHHPNDGPIFADGVALEEEINFKKNNVLKAQVTNPDGTPGSMTVNMVPHIGAKYVLVSNTANFEPAQTRVYRVVDRTAANVVINNGEYVGFGSYETAPGGVINGLKLWLRADDANSVNLNGKDRENVLIWKDQTDNGNDYSFAAVNFSRKTPPSYLLCNDKMNFQPTVQFDLNSYLGIIGGPMSVNAPDDFTSFVVYYNTALSGDARRMYTHGFGNLRGSGANRGVNPDAGTRFPAMGFYPASETGRIWANGGGSGIDGNLDGFKQYTTALHMIHTRKNSASSGLGRLLEHDFGGYGEIMSATVPNPGRRLTNAGFGNNFLMATSGLLGGSSLEPNTAGTNSHGSFQGLISEVFFYERDLEEPERDKLRTYMAIKYGITLDRDIKDPENNYNYVLSDGTIVWEGNAAPNKGYHNNVVGLVYDKPADLRINKAKSSANGATITMIAAGHTECGQGDESALANEFSGLYWGNDGGDGEISLKGNTSVCGTMDFMMGRIWLVDKTNLEEQEVTIRIGESSFFNYASSNYQVYFLVGDSPDDFNIGSAESPSGNMWQQAIPTTFVDGEHQLTYKFTKEYTYFTLGVKKISEGVCESCEFSGVKKLSFTNTTWPRGTREKQMDLGDGFVVNLKTTVDLPSTFYNTRYPMSSTGSSLRLYRRGATAVSGTPTYMTTEITLPVAAGASFQIYEIDREGSNRYDEVEVYGLCGDAKVAANLSYVTTPARSSYTIMGYKAIAKRRPTSGYNTNAGKMNVEFDYPVEKIVIVQKISSSTNGTQWIGVGPVSFTCPQPLPPVNEDGLIFVKQATPELLLCEQVEFKYTIINTNCSPKAINFTDQLPEGMTWVSNSLSTQPWSAMSVADDNSYAGTRNLKLDNITVLGADTLIVRMGAVFDMDAVAGLYDTGKATIEYKRIVEDEEEDASMQSCDRLTPGCASTKVNALDVPNRPYPVKLVSYGAGDCYKEDGSITVSIKIQNQNTYAIADAELFVSFNEEFAYVANSLASTTMGPFTTPEVDTGTLFVSGFTVPDNAANGTGESTISFSIKAPDEDDLVKWVDEDGNMLDAAGEITLDPEEQAYQPLEIYFEMGVNSDDVCIGNAFINVNGDMYLPYCTAIPCVITNRHVTPRIKRK